MPGWRLTARAGLPVGVFSIPGWASSGCAAADFLLGMYECLRVHDVSRAPRQAWDSVSRCLSPRFRKRAPFRPSADSSIQMDLKQSIYICIRQ
jgi:hypothetical protein